MNAGAGKGGPRESNGPPGSGTVVGESLVDLICMRPVPSFDQADACGAREFDSPRNRRC
jgi:hypothetical protein